MNIIAIANQKGGVGKSTTAINLSGALAQKGKKILLIDLDPQANTTSGIGEEASSTGCLYLPLIGQAQIEDKIIPTRIKNLSLIPGDMDLAGVEIELAQMPDYLSRLRDLLEKLGKKQDYDFIILDTPPSLGILMTSALAAADEVIIPLQCEWFGLEGLAKIVHIIDQIRDSGSGASVQLEGILMTMYDSRNKLSEMVANDVRSHFGNLVYTTVIPRNVRISEAPSFGQPVLIYDLKCAGAQAYVALAAELLSQEKEAA